MDWRAVEEVSSSPCFAFDATGPRRLPHWRC